MTGLTGAAISIHTRKGTATLDQLARLVFSAISIHTRKGTATDSRRFNSARISDFNTHPQGDGNLHILRVFFLLLISIHTRKGTATITRSRSRACMPHFNTHPQRDGNGSTFSPVPRKTEFQYTPARGRQHLQLLIFLLLNYLNTHPQGGAEGHVDLA